MKNIVGKIISKKVKTPKMKKEGKKPSVAKIIGKKVKSPKLSKLVK